jgi:hypothetical protein
MEYLGKPIYGLLQTRFYEARENRNYPTIFRNRLQHPISTTAVKWFMRRPEKPIYGSM